MIFDPIGRFKIDMQGKPVMVIFRLLAYFLAVVVVSDLVFDMSISLTLMLNSLVALFVFVAIIRMLSNMHDKFD